MKLNPLSLILCILVLAGTISYVIPQGFAEVTGPSMNPPNQYLGIHHGHLVIITETGKNSAIDDAGNTWTFAKTWKMNVALKKHVDDKVTSKWLDRNHTWFSYYKKGQELLAEHILNKIMRGKSIQNDSFYSSKNFEPSIDKKAYDINYMRAMGFEPTNS